jgi:hypothetical protein
VQKLLLFRNEGNRPKVFASSQFSKISLTPPPSPDSPIGKDDLDKKNEAKSRTEHTKTL